MVTREIDPRQFLRNEAETLTTASESEFRAPDSLSKLLQCTAEYYRTRGTLHNLSKEERVCGSAAEYSSEPARSIITSNSNNPLVSGVQGGVSDEESVIWTHNGQ